MDLETIASEHRGELRIRDRADDAAPRRNGAFCFHWRVGQELPDVRDLDPIVEIELARRRERPVEVKQRVVFGERYVA